MATRFVLPFADVGSGILPSAGARLEFFRNKTTEDKDTFTAPDGLTSNSNPVVSDANGLFPDIFISGSYTVVLRDSGGVLKWEADDVDSFRTIEEDFSTNIIKESITVSASQTVIVITARPIAVNVIVDTSVLLESEGAYTYSTSTGIITLETALTGNEEVEVQYGLITSISPPSSSTIADKGFVTYEDFGVDLTGVISADAEIDACHVFANTNNLPVRQNNGTVYWTGSKNSIVVKTNTDLRGMIVRVDGASGTVGPTSNQIGMYLIERDVASVTLDASQLAQLNTTFIDQFKKGSFAVPESIFSQYQGAMIRMDGTSEITRSSSGMAPVAKIECWTKTKGQLLDQPQYERWGGDIKQCIVFPRSKGYLEFQAPRLDINGANSFFFIKCQRSQTKISNLIVQELGLTAPSAIRELVEINQCADIHLSDWSAVAMDKSPTGEASYGLVAATVVNLHCDRLRGNGGWGITGNNYLKNVYFNECAINRIDCHWSVFNFHAERCQFINWGARLSGAGRAVMKDCEYYLTGNQTGTEGSTLTRSLFATREDYGGEWDGDITIDGVRIVVDPARLSFDNSITLRIVDIYPESITHNYGRAQVHGRSITVKNVSVELHNSIVNSDTFEMNINCISFRELTNNQQDQFYPLHITVKNVRCNTNAEKVFISAYESPNYLETRCKALIDANNPDEGDANHFINVSNIITGLNANQTAATAISKIDKHTVKFGLNYDNADAAYKTGVDRLKPYIRVDKVENFSCICAVMSSWNITQSTIQATSPFGAGQNNQPTIGDVRMKFDNCDVKLRSNKADADNYNAPLDTLFTNCKLQPTRNRAGVIDTFNGVDLSTRCFGNEINTNAVTINLPANFTAP